MPKSALFMIFTVLFSSCSLLTTYPDQLRFEDRIAFFDNVIQPPLEKEVVVHWNLYAIPFIEAQNDQDLAFTVGALHAHLRIDQLEFMRILSQGRLSEVAGPIPLIQNIDHGLRIIDLKKAAQRTLEVMKPQSRNWMENFTAGINWYIKQMKRQPITNKVFNQDLKPYTLLDVLTISRLASADLSWAIYLKYLKYAENKNWPKVFDFARKKLTTDHATFDNTSGDKLSQLIQAFSKSGSNSVVIQGNKTQSGAAMIASDPHVGLLLPNFWLLMGIKSPRYHAFGMMIPGVPIIGVGRNQNIAWGGTNMRGISTHLYDVSKLPDNQIKTQTSALKRRWWFDSEVQIRSTAYGNILTDLNYFEKEKLPFQVALNWVGHKGSDEIDSFLQIARARNWQEFKNAFQDYRVSAMNMLYADHKGNIGMVGAYGQPVLKDPSKTLELIKTPDNPIVSIRSPLDNPTPYNPSQGYLVSANNKPFKKPNIPVAFSYANNDRFDRLTALISNKQKIDIHFLKALQSDVFSQKAYDLKENFLKKIVSSDFLLSKPVIQTLKLWDGHFKSDSSAALVFYSLMHSFWQEHLKQYKDTLLFNELQSYDNWKPLLHTWMNGQSKDLIIEIAKKSLPAIESFVQKYKSWGQFTRQSQKTILGMLPLIGSRFRYPDYPVSGSPDTINKYGRPFRLEKSEVTYGASARHISDMSSLDENYFVLHGGQDSWIMNENLADQTKLWRTGQYIKIPLSMTQVKKSFNKHTLRLKPQK